MLSKINLVSWTKINLRTSKYHSPIPIKTINKTKRNKKKSQFLWRNLWMSSPKISMTIELSKSLMRKTNLKTSLFLQDFKSGNTKLTPYRYLETPTLYFSRYTRKECQKSSLVQLTTWEASTYSALRWAKNNRKELYSWPTYF